LGKHAFAKGTKEEGLDEVQERFSASDAEQSRTLCKDVSGRVSVVRGSFRDTKSIKIPHEEADKKTNKKRLEKKVKKKRL